MKIAGNKKCYSKKIRCSSKNGEYGMRTFHLQSTITYDGSSIVLVAPKLFWFHRDIFSRNAFASRQMLEYRFLVNKQLPHATSALAYGNRYNSA